jgi:hypothetical protein
MEVGQGPNVGCSAKGKKIRLSDHQKELSDGSQNTLSNELT